MEKERSSMVSQQYGGKRKIDGTMTTQLSCNSSIKVPSSLWATYEISAVQVLLYQEILRQFTRLVLPQMTKRCWLPKKTRMIKLLYLQAASTSQKIPKMQKLCTYERWGASWGVCTLAVQSRSQVFCLGAATGWSLIKARPANDDP